MSRTVSETVVGLLLTSASVLQAADIGTAFTYQGFLEKPAGSPVTDTCDFRFGLWKDETSISPADQAGLSISAGVAVVNGVFTTTLAFDPNAIDGTARWLEIEACCPSPCAPQMLTPRVELTPAPHALALPGLYTQQNATSPNIIGGYQGNLMDPISGGVIAGGGFAAAPNRIYDHFNAIGGGANNFAGTNNANADDAQFVTIAGGAGNMASAGGSTIAGGESNTTSGPATTVAGGTSNVAGPGARATVGGGLSNTGSADYSTVAGGDTNVASGRWCTIGGGDHNTATVNDATIAGGWANIASAVETAIGGGNHNTASGYAATVGGGEYNVSGKACVDGPDVRKACQSDADCSAPGICSNAIPDLATVGGGTENAASGSFATVGGGIENRATGITQATVGGGGGNTASGHSSTVGGGVLNTASAGGSTVGGGQYNVAGKACVGGTDDGRACESNADCAAPGTCSTANPEFATVGGGIKNTASGGYSFVGGGYENTANATYSTVGCGLYNDASGHGSTVPGGVLNMAGGDYSFAAGLRTKVRSGTDVGGGDTNGDEGTFIWGDTTTSIFDFFTSTGPNQFLIRAAGGVGINTNDPTTALAALEVDQSSTTPFARGVYGVITSTSPGDFSAAVRGENLGTGSHGIGVHGTQAGSGWGVYGQVSSGIGVYGIASSPAAGVGVYGQTMSSSGVGVTARGSGPTGTALQIVNGAIKVANAGIGTSTAAFIHWVTAGNRTCGFLQCTTITHPMTDGDPNAILIVTQHWKGVYNPHPIGVYYAGSQWAIFNEDVVAMPVDAFFNVLVIKTGAATAGATVAAGPEDASEGDGVPPVSAMQDDEAITRTQSEFTQVQQLEAKVAAMEELVNKLAAQQNGGGR